MFRDVFPIGMADAWRHRPLKLEALRRRTSYFPSVTESIVQECLSTKQPWILACILWTQNIWVNMLLELLISARQTEENAGCALLMPPFRRIIPDETCKEQQTHLGRQEELKKNWTFQALDFEVDFAVELYTSTIYINIYNYI